jgi:spore germination protein KC
MAIDINNNEYEVSVLISNSPKSSNQASGKNYTTVVYSGKGKTIYEAIKQIGLISPKELYIGHLSVLIISEDVAKTGINSSIEFLLQEPRSKKNFYVAISKDSKAKDVLSVTSPLTYFASQNLATNLKTTTSLQGSVNATDFNTTLYKLVNIGIDLSLNGFSIVGDTKNGVKNSNIETNVPKAYIKLSPLAIFKDDKLVSWTTKNESRGINIINDKIKEIYLRLDCDQGDIVVDTEDLETKKAIDKNGNVTLKTSGKASISEISCDIDLTKQSNINKLEKRIETKIKELENKAIKLSKKYSTDIFGIGLMYYQDNPDKYNKIKDYDKFYKTIKFTTKVDIKLNTLGSIKQTLERIENEENN